MPAEPPDQLHEAPATLADVRKVAEAGRLWAVLDACDAPGVPVKVHSLGPERGVSLYKGRSEEKLWAIAPYLVSLDAALLDWIAETLWPEPWGILAEAKGTLEELRTHFRKFLVVQGPRGEEMYFRFYDPRVLLTFLRTATEEERRELFGPVSAYHVIAGDGEARALVAVRRTAREPGREAVR